MTSVRIAIIGRPNVGKSTLFNQLTRQRALIDNQPGVTRDRRCGTFATENGVIELIDTAGFLDESTDDLQNLMNEQTELAIQVASAIWMVVDSEQGPTELDRVLWNKISQLDVPVLLLVNKADRLTHQEESAEFYQLGSEYQLVSGKTRAGITALTSWAESLLTPTEDETEKEEQQLDHICVLGRPNAGKSTLCNALLKDNRVIVSDHAGTTRDAIEIPFKLGDKELILVDTAGVRRKSRVKIKLEQQMIWQALGTLKYSAVTIIVVDSTVGLTDQDLRLMQHTWQSGSGMLICLNKWDLLDQEARDTLFQFTKNYTKQWDTPIIKTSFSKGKGLALVRTNISKVIDSFNTRPSTAFLTKILNTAVKANPAPLSPRKTRVQLRFAHPIGYSPLRIKITGKQLDNLPGTYKKYIQNAYKSSLKLFGTTIFITYDNDSNPYQKK